MGDLLARPLRSLLSPPPKGPVCVGSIQPPRTLGEHKRPQAVPAKTARPADDRRAWRNNSGRRGAGTPLPGPGADLNPRPRGREQSLAPTSSAFGPSPLQGKRARIQVRPAKASTIGPRRHTATPSQDGKTGQRGPGHGSEHNQSRAIAHAVPGGRGNVLNAIQLLETRPGLAAQACPFKPSGSRTRRGPETGPRRARQRVLAARTRAGWPSPGA